MDQRRLAPTSTSRRPPVRLLLIAAAAVAWLLLPGAPAHAGGAAPAQAAGEIATAEADPTAAAEESGGPGSAEVPTTPAVFTGIGAAGLLVGLLVLAPVLLRRLGRLDEDPLPAGSAYRPLGSSD